MVTQIRGRLHRLKTLCKLFAVVSILLLATCYLLLIPTLGFAQKGLEESLSEVNRLLPSKEITPTPWGRDPFIPLIGVKEGIKRRDLRLSAIIYSEKRPSAIIDNKIVYIGDTIDGQKVIDIKQEHVILQVGDRPYRLELEGSLRRRITIKEAP